MQILNAYKGKVRQLSFSAAGTHLASLGGSAKLITLWELVTLRAGKLGGRSPYGPHEIAFAPRGSGFLAHHSHEVRHWPDPMNDSFCRVYPRGNRAVWSPDGSLLAVVESTYNPRATWQLSHELRVVHAADGTPNQNPPVLLPAWLLHLRWSPVETLVAGVRCSGGLSTILLIRPGEPDPVRDCHVLYEPVNDLRFHPEGQIVALACGPAIHRRNLVTGEDLPLLRGHKRLVNALAYLPDGRLLSCSNDGTVRTWDHDSGKCLDVRDWQLGELSTLVVAVDGMRAAVGSKRGTILIWDLD